MPAMMRVAPAPGRVLRGSRAMLALGLAMLLPACSPAAEETERGNGTAPAPEASRPADAVISPTASGAGVAEQVAAKRRTLIAEAVEALRETESALGLLAAGKADEARAALARATGKLEVVLAADPDLALAPVDVQATVHDVVIAPVEVETIRRKADEALNQGRLQDARRMIAELASEHVISVTNIPLAT